MLLAIAARGHKISTRKVIKEAPWHIVIFSLGMYLVVYGLRNAGLTGYLAGWLDDFAGYGVWGAAMGTGVLTALLSSMMNNLPTVLIGLLSIDSSQATGVVKEAMICANVIGSDRRLHRSAVWRRCCGCMGWSAGAFGSAGDITSRWGLC